MTIPKNIELHLYRTKTGGWGCRADSSQGRHYGHDSRFPMPSIVEALNSVFSVPKAAEEAAGVTHHPECDLDEDCTCAWSCPYCRDTGIAFDPMTGEGPECPECQQS